MTTTSSKRHRSACDCGVNDFYVDEAIGHLAEVEDGKLVVVKQDWVNEVRHVLCRACDTEFKLHEFDSSELF